MNRVRKHRVACFAMLIALSIVAFPRYSCAKVKVWWVKADAWQIFSKMEKSTYITGVLDALIFAQNDFSNAVSYATSQENYINALDDFYKDYRNSLIPAVCAIRIVSLEMKGESKEVIEEELRSLRSQFHEFEKKRSQDKASSDDK